MAVPLMRDEAPAPTRKADLHGLAFLATIAIVMTAWIAALIWAAMAFLTWLVS